MNYYNPSFYPNYGYGQQYAQPQQIAYPQPTLNGKIVDTIDAVKASDVPIGGYGIYPKADLSEIYIKSWTQNGTTAITAFKPYALEEKPEDKNINDVLNRLSLLEEKLDKILSEREVQYHESNANGANVTKQF